MCSGRSELFDVAAGQCTAEMSVGKQEGTSHQWPLVKCLDVWIFLLEAVLTVNLQQRRGLFRFQQENSRPDRIVV